MFQIYKDRNEYCRYCGDRAKAYYQNTPVCNYHYKKQIENESEEKKLKKIWFSNLWDIRETKAGKWALCIDEPVLPATYTEDIYFNGELVQTVTGTNLGGLTPTEISNLKDSVIWPTS